MFDFSHMSTLPAFPLNPATGQIQLEGTSLHGKNLTGADLTNASLQGVNLEGANLTNADLQGANLQGVNTNKVIWSNTICPDGTNSTSDGGTCAGHL